MGKPRRITPTDNWQQLQLFLTSPEQERYEEIRPIVLFGQPPAARSRETGTPAHTLRRRADRFVAHGMVSLFDAPPPFPQPVPPALPQALPPELREMIIDLKVEHPPLRVHEIATICYARTGRRPDAKTIKRISRLPSHFQSASSAAFRPTIRFLIQPSVAPSSCGSTSRAGRSNPLPSTWRRAGRPCMRPYAGTLPRDSQACIQNRVPPNDAFGRSNSAPP